MQIHRGGWRAVVFACALGATSVHAAASGAAMDELRSVAERIDTATRDTLAAHAEGRAPAPAAIAAAARAKTELETLTRNPASDPVFARKQLVVRHRLANLEHAQALSRDAALPALVVSTDPKQTAHAMPGGAGSTCATALTIVPGHPIETTLADAGTTGAALWVRIAPTDVRFLALDTRPTPLDTEIALFGATCPETESEALASNDDGFGLAASLTIDTQQHRGTLLARISNLGRAGRAVARLETPGAFAGRISDERTGDGLHATVETLTALGFYMSSTDTNPDSGLYLLAADPGGYYVYAEAWPFYPDDYLPELYPDVACAYFNCDTANATLLTLADGQQMSGIDLALNLGGRIAGTVSDATTGMSIPNAFVEIYADGQNYYFDNVQTDSAGRYAFHRLVTGSYRLIAREPSHGSQLWNHVACTGPVENDCDPSNATPLPVTRNALTTGIDFSLPREAHLHATLAMRDGSPLPSWWVVTLYDTAGNLIWQYGANPDGTLDAGPLAPGTYLAAAEGQGIFGQVWNGIDCTTDCTSALATGTPITITRGGEVDIAFAPLSLPKLTGTVTDATTHAPVAGASIMLAPVDLSFSNSYAYTDSAGHYVVSDARPGAYYVLAYDDWHRPTAYPDAPCTVNSIDSCDLPSATPVTIAYGGGDQNDIDIAMPVDGSISGNVVLRTPAGSTLAPLAPVSAIISVSDADGFYVAYQYVSSDGSYVVPSLTAGTYHAVVTGDVFDEAYGGIDCVPQCDPDAGTPIVLAQGQNASNVDFNPISRLYIFGRVTEAGGAPVPHVAIDLWRDDDGAHCGATTTNADGYYGISSTLDSCPYDHWLSTDVPLPWVNQVYDGIVCPNGSVWLGLCSLEGGTGVPFPTSPGFVIANFPLGARVDAILANGFDP